VESHRSRENEAASSEWSPLTGGVCGSAVRRRRMLTAPIQIRINCAASVEVCPRAEKTKWLDNDRPHRSPAGRADSGQKSRIGFDSPSSRGLGRGPIPMCLEPLALPRR
jgi:hypothetical protein